MGADDLESSAVLLGSDFFVDEVDHDDFGEYSFEVSSGQLEDHSSLADCDYLRASFDQAMIEEVFGLKFA